jgi:hypothetical protein
MSTFLGAMLCPKVDKPTKAVWRLKSQEDRRWNDRGAFIYKGMRGIPFECSVRIEEMKLEFGNPPEDLEWGFRLSTWRYYMVLFWKFFVYVFLFINAFVFFRRKK